MEIQQDYWNNYYESNLQSTADNVSLGAAEFESTFLGNVWNELNGKNAQLREYAQQEYLQDKQNEYNTPAAQMARMKAAGINANTAAAGIAQGGNESAQAPAVSSNTQGAANGLNALAGAANAVTGGISNLAGADLADAQAELAGEEATRIRTLLPLDTQLSLENIGLVRGQAQALAIENHYRPQQLMLDIAEKRLNLPILKQQVKNLRAQYTLSLAEAKKAIQDIEESKGRVDLMTYQKNLYTAQTNNLNIQTQYTNAMFMLLRDFRWDPSTGLGGLLAGQFLSLPDSGDAGEDFNEEFVDRILNTLYSINYMQYSGQSQGSFEAQKGLIKAQEEAEHKLKQHQYHLDKGKDANRSLLDVLGSHVEHHGFGAGPISIH